MQKQALRFLSGLALLLAASSAFAQTHLRANIPFDFMVDKAKLAAGEYDISSAGFGTEKTLLLRNSDGKTLRMIIVNPVQANRPSSQTKLVFRRYGDRYFLSQIWVEGWDIGRELPRSAREAEMALDYSPTKVFVLAEMR